MTINDNEARITGGIRSVVAKKKTLIRGHFELTKTLNCEFSAHLSTPNFAHSK